MSYEAFRGLLTIVVLVCMIDALISSAKARRHARNLRARAAELKAQLERKS